MCFPKEGLVGTPVNCLFAIRQTDIATFAAAASVLKVWPHLCACYIHCHYTNCSNSITIIVIRVAAAAASVLTPVGRNPKLLREGGHKLRGSGLSRSSNMIIIIIIIIIIISRSSSSSSSSSSSIMIIIISSSSSGSGGSSSSN